MAAPSEGNGVWIEGAPGRASDTPLQRLGQRLDVGAEEATTVPAASVTTPVAAEVVVARAAASAATTAWAPSKGTPARLLPLNRGSLCITPGDPSSLDVAATIRVPAHGDIAGDGKDAIDLVLLLSSTCCCEVCTVKEGLHLWVRQGGASCLHTSRKLLHGDRATADPPTKSAPLASRGAMAAAPGARRQGGGSG